MTLRQKSKAQARAISARAATRPPHDDFDEVEDFDADPEDGDFDFGFDLGLDDFNKDTPKDNNEALADSWLKGLADALNPDNISEKALWSPNVGPQTRAFNSEADELLYGGAAGGGKTDLMLGLALSDMSPHKKAIIFRRSYPELKDIVIRARDILADTDAKFRGGNAMRFDNLPFGKSLELGSVATFSAAQKYKGRPHDLKLFDEVSDISESVYTFLIGWARTSDPDIHVRVVAAGNPPTNSDGEWVIRRWSPWIDKSHPNRAEPGELRWFATLDGEDREITPEFNEPGSRGEAFEYTDKMDKTELIKPKSRTFIPALLEDNPILMATDYKSILQNMPEPYRSQLLYGDFGLSQRADPWQVIPTEWVRLAQKRWAEGAEEGLVEKLSQGNVTFGLDVAEGGADSTVLIKLTHPYVQWVQYIKDEDTMKQADLVENLMRGNKRIPIGVDSNGVGLGLFQRLRQKGMTVMGIKGSRESTYKDKSGNFEFNNTRCELWWRMRESFDPDSENPIAIPPSDKRLFAELVAPRYDLTPSGRVRVETQDQIKKKIGRSPDAANSLMYAIFVQQKRSRPIQIA